MSDTKYFVFYCQIPNSTYIFPDGTQAVFVGGRYATSDTSKATQLQAEIDAGNAHFYINPDKLQVTEEELDPMAEYNARVIADYLAKQASKTSNDMGTSEQGKLNVADSNTIGEAAAASNGVGTAGIKVSIPVSK